MLREEVLRTTMATSLLTELGVKSGLYVTNRLTQFEPIEAQGVLYTQGFMFTQDLGKSAIFVGMPLRPLV